MTEFVKALTIWQPWATFIMALAKPFEFRGFDYRIKNRSIEGNRIVIHAGKRPIKFSEMIELKARIEDGSSALIADRALPIIERLIEAPKCRGVLPMSAALGTVVIGRPRRADGLFKKPDSDRLDHHVFAWPMIDPQPFEPPIDMRGLQGFWNFPAAMMPKEQAA